MTSQQLFSAWHHIRSDYFMHYKEKWLWLPSNCKQKTRYTKNLNYRNCQNKNLDSQNYKFEFVFSNWKF